MRGLDTNVLVRFLTADDPEQAEAALRLVEIADSTGERLHISNIVLAELVWVLRGGCYCRVWRVRRATAIRPTNLVQTALDHLAT